MQRNNIIEETRPPFIIQGFIRFPGVPGLPDQVPELDAYIREQYEPTEMPFRVYPPPLRRPPPEHRLQVLKVRR